MYTINAGALKLQLNEKGQITAMNDSRDHAYASTSQTTVLIRIVIDGRMEVPSQASLNAVLGLITFEFADSGAVVDVLIVEKSQYATFEIQRIEGADVDGVIWGPYMTTVAVQSVNRLVSFIMDNSQSAFRH